MRPVLAAAFWLLTATALASQTLPVRSGEHDGFTRLVVPIGARDWSLRGEGRERQIVFSPDAPDLDLSGVFEMVPRDRLQAVAGGETLTLTLGCDCAVTAFRFRSGFLVVDIADPGPETGDTAARTPPAAAWHGNVPAVELPNPFDTPQITLDLLELVPLEPAEIPAPPAPQAANQPRPGSPAADMRANEAAALLAEQLARAAAAGLLEAAPDQPLSIGDPVPAGQAARGGGAPEDPVAEMPPAATGGATGDLAVDPALNGFPVRAETAFDVIRHWNDGAEPARRSLTCDPETRFDIAHWARGDGFEQEIGWLRTRLYDDRDRLREDSVIALAEYYIYHGFGAEAAWWLRRLPFPPESHLSLARLIDGAPGPVFPPIDSLDGCSDTELMFRYLDAVDPPGLSDEQVGAILRAHAALPTGLRDLMGPDLARRLNAEGHSAAARDVRDTLLRGARLAESTQLLLDLDVNAPLPDDPAATLSSLRDILRTDTANAPEAMVRFLTIHRETGRVVAEEYLVATDAMLREGADAETGGALWREAISANAASGRLDRAMQLLAQTPDAGSDLFQSVLTDLFETLADREAMPELVLLNAAFGEVWEARSGALETRLAVVRLLSEAGLPDLARNLAFEAARIRPITMPGAEPPDDPGAAALAAAWAGRDWPRLAELGGGVHAEIAGRLAAPDRAPPDPSDGDALHGALADSRETRRLVETLLGNPAPQPPD